jgi:hypothetical protein
VERLSMIRVALMRELAWNDARLRFINTRLILSVGIDLNEISNDDDNDPRKVEIAREALTKMGFLKSGDARG